jgi:murein DD-endopeptidase MepM/ murein hydrolase activator NlpD
MSEDYNRHDEGDAYPDHLADTNPMPAVRELPLPLWRRLVGLLSLLAAVGLTFASAVILIMPASAPTPVPAVGTPNGASDVPTALPATPVPVDVQPDMTSQHLVAAPTLSPEQIAALLAQPVTPAAVASGFTFIRNDTNPFTIIPDRPRREITEYTVVAGDTMYTIAERFGIQPESLAWSNPRSIIGGLRPGMSITVPPADGAVEQISNDRTIADLAVGYSVDPFAIIDWESNGLQGATPDTVLLSGMNIFVPGGQAEQISWTPRVERSGGDASGTGGTISFAIGDPGSCGQQPNPGGFGGWIRPVGGYSFVQGFSGFHTGVDLAAPVGTPVSAALGGTVIFRGWNNWGYGYLIVLAHGPITTVYGHLSEIYVSCGQSVAPGTVIGGVGNTGNSSGPHLHFEIRFSDIPTDPTGTMAF